MQETPVATPPESRTAASSAPVMDVVAPPPGTPDVTKPALPKPAAQPAKPAAKPSTKQGIGAAIFATVVIVLGLAALAVYAYLKQKS